MISFKNKSVIVFDLDYTIVKLKADWHALRRELNRRYSELYGYAEFKTMTQCLTKIVEKKDWEQLEQFLSVMRRYELENIEDTSLIDETVFFIKNREKFGIHNDVKIAV